jgi:predicted phosphoribosyltransferase
MTSPGSLDGLDLRNRNAIAVDEGRSVITLLRAASAALRQRWAARVVLACPTMPAAVFRELFREADEIVTAVTARAREWGGNAVSPTEVSRLLRQSAIAASGTMPAYQMTRRPVDMSYPLVG